MSFFVKILFSLSLFFPLFALEPETFSIYKDQLDYTQGFGAFMDLRLKPKTINFDNGGGKYDFASQFLEKNFGVTNIVYDPFLRSENENKKALSLVQEHIFDSSTSNSVLNVIQNSQDRQEHIFLSCEALKEYGVAYFKIFEGDKDSTFIFHQENRSAISYQKEIERVFGKGNVVTDVNQNLIIAYKNCGCKH